MGRRSPDGPDCLTVAFPNISTGAYGFPADLAADVATGGVQEWIDTNPDAVTEISFACYTEENLRLYRILLG